MTTRFPQPPTEPPDEPARCLWCDGQGEVTVHAVLDVSGQVQSVWSLPNATSIEDAKALARSHRRILWMTRGFLDN